MRIQGTAAALSPTTSPTAKRAASGTFSLEGDTAARGTTAASGTRSIGGIDALLALQSVEDPGERRRKAVRRGRSALDALDALKLGLLSGTYDTSALARLKSAAASLAEPSGDPALDAVLAEIELRAQVELAKIGMPEPGRQDAA
jgi:hypothetical protein